MNIREELTCKYCYQIYKNLITLACGCNICKHHIDALITNDSSNEFPCLLCNRVNAKQNFSVNKLIEGLVGNELHKLEVNSEHKSVLNRLQTEIAGLENILNDPENVIYEEISELKRQVDLDRERMKLEIDVLADELIEQLEAHEARFKAAIKTLDLSHFKDLVDSSKKQLAEYEKCLNLFSANKEERARQTKESEEVISQLELKIKKIKEKLLNSSITYKPKKYRREDLFGKIEVGFFFNFQF